MAAKSVRILLMLHIIFIFVNIIHAQGDGTLRDILSNESCQIACFLGIEPGKTTEQELQTILAAHNLEYSVSPIVGVIVLYEFNASAVSVHIEGMVSVDVRDGLVDNVFVDITDTPLTTILSLYGSPENLIDAISVFAVYPQEGLNFFIDDKNTLIVDYVMLMTEDHTRERVYGTYPVLQPCTAPPEICNIITTNHPTAAAGPDQTVTDADSSGSEVVPLDGSASSDPDGQIVAYLWAENGVEIATGPTPTVDLPLGAHTLTLTVTDDSGLTASDEVVITVVMAGQGNDNIRDLLSDDNCQAACFLGIEPGITTNAEVKTILSLANIEYELGTIGFSNRQSYSFDASGISSHFSGGEGSIWAGENEEDVVWLIYLPLSDISVNDVLSLYGPPARISFSGTIELVYPNERLVFIVDFDPSMISSVEITTLDTLTVRYIEQDSLLPCIEPVEICSIITTNHPTAAAGPDQTVTDADSSGSEVVTLDGSASSDPDGQIVAYSWAENGVVSLAAARWPYTRHCLMAACFRHSNGWLSACH